MLKNFTDHLQQKLKKIETQGLYKKERLITGRQGSEVSLSNEQRFINLCANNYLGLAGQQWLVDEAKNSLDAYGYGLSSVRFICGTQDLHRQLEQALAAYLKKDDVILYSSCFDANGGLFEAILTEEDAIISDELNHASIIDGVRLSKAKRYRYKNNNPEDLEKQLKQAKEDGARFLLVITDGVFSMDGIIASLPELSSLCEKYGAILAVDDSHATGFMGQNGRGTPEFSHVEDRVHILTGTLGKALGGASGGYIAGPQAVIDILRQKSRPYLFSNTLAPVITGVTLKVLDFLQSQQGQDLRQKLWENTAFMRQSMKDLGYKIIDGEHPIIPVMLGDAVTAQKLSARMLELGVYVVGFFYPVVPQGKARIRMQISAIHEKEQLQQALAAYAQAGKELGII